VAQQKANQMTSTTQLTFVTGKGRHRAWLARITGRDAQYGLAREFLRGNDSYDNGYKVTYDVPLNEGEIYEDWTGDFYVARDGALVEVSRHDKAEVLALLDARAQAAEQPAAPATKPVVGPFDALAREAGYVEPALPITPASVMFAVHGPDGAKETKLGDLDWLRLLLRSCQNPGAFEALDGEDGDPDATSMMLRGVEDLYRRLARLTGGNPAIYDSETRHEAPAQGYFIALPTKLAMNEIEAIWGIGCTAEEAWGDAWGSLNCRLPAVEEVDGSWQIWNPINQTTEEFPTEEAAQEALRETGFRAEPCTEALYLRVKAEGYDAHGRNSYNYVLNGRVYDVEEREAA
jgi:hypothetical protein